MDTTEINAKIEKVHETINKKNDLISKRFEVIKRTNQNLVKAITNLGGNITLLFSEDTEALKSQNDEAENYIKAHGIINGEWNHAWYSLIWDFTSKVDDYVDSIVNARRSIKEKTETLERYNVLLAKAQEKENTLNNLPACMIEFMNDAIELWDVWDKMRRESVRQAQERYYKLVEEQRKVRWDANKGKDSEEFREITAEMKDIEDRYSFFEWHELRSLDDEEIHQRNVKAGKSLVADLYDRICAIVTTFEDASDLKVTRGNNGFAVINGLVKGNGKTAKVQSIGAGGYNIQRFHIRTLVHEVH